MNLYTKAKKESIYTFCFSWHPIYTFFSTYLSYIPISSCLAGFQEKELLLLLNCLVAKGSEMQWWVTHAWPLWFFVLFFNVLWVRIRISWIHILLFLFLVNWNIKSYDWSEITVCRITVTLLITYCDAFASISIINQFFWVYSLGSVSSSPFGCNWQVD